MQHKRRLTEGLDEQGELLDVVRPDKVIDLEAVWGRGACGGATLCTGDDDVRHARRVLEIEEAGMGKLAMRFYT